MKKDISVKLKMRSSIILKHVPIKSYKKDIINVEEETSAKKEEKKNILTKSIIPFNLNIELPKYNNKFPEKNNFIPSPNKTKDIINKLIMKQIDKKKYIERIKFVKYKLYENHGYPYIDMNSDISTSDMPYLFYDYYKINKILKNKKCKLVSRYHEYNLFLNNNEYLIRYSPKKEYYIIMKYLLFFFYAYDRITYSQKCQKFYDLNEIKLSYDSLVSSYEEKEKKNNKIRNYVKKRTNNNINYLLSKFNSALNIKNEFDFSNYNSLNKNQKKFNKRHSINYGFSSKNDNLLNLNNPKGKSKLNKDVFYIGLGGDKNINLISCKLKKPVYLFIKDIPFKLIPNCLPNIFPIRTFMYNSFDEYIAKIKKIKLNIYSSKKEKKRVRLWEEYDEKKYNEFIKKISFSSEDFYIKEKGKGKETKKMNIYNNPNRRLVNDNEIIDIEKLIVELEDMPKKSENENIIISNNNLKSSDKGEISSSSSESKSKSESKNTKNKHKLKDSKDQKQKNKNYKNYKSGSSFSSGKSNFYSSGTSSGHIKSNEKEVKIDKNNNNNNNNINQDIDTPNSILKYFEDNNNNNLREKILEENNKIKENIKSSLLISKFNDKNNKPYYSDLMRYNKNIKNKEKNIFKKNSKNILSSDDNKNKSKIKLMKKDNKELLTHKNCKSYMPSIEDKNKSRTIDKNIKWFSCDLDSKPYTGKYNFKKTYEFAFGKYEERNKMKYKLNLIKDITTEFQKNIFLSRHKFKKKNKEYFPNLDFLIKCRKKNKDKKEEEKNINNNYLIKYRCITTPTSNKSKIKENKKF